MNKEVLESLPPQQRKTIEKLYMSVIRNEITPDEFFAECNAYLGNAIFEQLFPTEKEIKTEKLSDIIEYSGVNLKEEMEMMKGMENMEYMYQDTDIKTEMEYIVDSDLFTDFIKSIVSSRSISITTDAVKYLFYALRRYLIDLIEKIDRACYFRVDPGKLKYNLKMENDIKRQLWYLDEREKKDMLNFKESEKKEKKVIQEREDLLIKKRLSNTVALAALGSQKKSWMDADVVEDNQFLSLYAPVDEREIEKKINNRRLTMDDFLFVFERDKRYSKSIFTVQLYYKK